MEYIFENSKSYDFKEKNYTKQIYNKNDIPHIQSFNNIITMFDNKQSIFNQILKERMEIKKKEYKDKKIPSFPINSKINSTGHFNINALKTFITSNPNLPSIKKEKNDSKYININNNFIKLLDKEIKKFEEISHKPKIVKNSFDTNNKDAYNYNNDEEYQKDFYLTQQLIKTNVEIIAPGALEKREKAMKKIPYIIKCMEKKKNNSLYNKKLIDKDYNLRYSKQNVNIEEILLNHNMNERKGVSSKKNMNFYYSVNNERIKKNLSQKAIKKTLSSLSSSNEFNTPSNFSSIYLGFTSKKLLYNN